MPGFTVHPKLEGTSPLTTRELYGRNYFITPMSACDEKFFQGPVEYVPNVTSQWAAAVRRVPNPSNPDQLDLHIEKMYDLVRLKSEVWEFQSEYRFFLFAMPMLPPFEPNGTDLPTVEQMLSTSAAMQMNVDPIATYIDVPLASEALEQLVIRTGPLTSDEDRAKVDEIVSQFAPKALIIRSALDGQIRRRKKST